MVGNVLSPAGYTIPRYRAPEDVTWYHVLHGNVPNHQIDFMYSPEVPQGLLTPTHFSHLARLMKYIEPQTNSSHAFAIGNLSRDDTQHEAGHGAVGLIFGMRIGGATDHAGRRNPPFAHGILTVDRELTYATLLEASATFYRHVMNAGDARSSIGDFYGDYVRSVVERPDHVSQLLARYVEEYNDLPELRRSGLPWDWIADEDPPRKRVVIVHSDDESFGSVAHAAAKLGALLYRSNIRWTSITTGREADIPGGVSVHLVAERDVTTEDRRVGLLRIEDLTDDEAEIARTLFGARPRSAESEGRRYAGWRERFGAKAVGDGDPSAAPQALQPRRAFGSSPSAQEVHARGLGEHGTEILERGALVDNASVAWAQRAEGSAAEAGAPSSAGEAAAPIGRERWTGRFDRSPMPDRSPIPDAPAAAGAHAGPGGAAGSFEQTARTRAALAAAAGGPAAVAAASAGAAGAGLPGAGVASAGSAPGWRDAGAPAPAPPLSNGPGGSSNGVASASVPRASMKEVSGSDDIEITVEKPPSSGKTWMLVAIGVVCLAAVVVFFTIPRDGPDTDASAPAPSTAPVATGGTPGDTSQGAVTTAVPPTPEQSSKATAVTTKVSSSGTGVTPPIGTKVGTTRPPKPPKTTCKVFGDTLCPK